MSFFPIKASDWNKEALETGTTDIVNGRNKKSRRKTKLPMTKAQGDEYEFKKLGQIKPHSIEDIKRDQAKRLQEAGIKASMITDILALKMPKNYDLSKKRDQNRAIILVKNANLFATELELVSFMKAFIFPR